MGYTHYWRVSEALANSDWFNTLERCNKILRALPDGIIGGPLGDGPWKEKHDSIGFNGVGELAHETFMFENVPTEFDFCKTARKPYDVAVVACLVVLSKDFGEKIHVSSDGDPPEWEVGLKFASSVLKEEFTVPSGVSANE